MSEVLHALTHYKDIDWIAPYERVSLPESLLTSFFRTTKRIHNALQGDDITLTPEEKKDYEKYQLIPPVPGH